MLMVEDEYYIKKALDLARLGAGLVSPNPMVGAVLVKDGRVIGEGYHRYDLLKHAESYAIEASGTSARGSTLYCSLEPCCHHGRTPPCTDALIEAGISRAVIAVEDPDSRVGGRGILQLRAAGIEVEVGPCREEALALNEAYFKFTTRGLPFVHAVAIDPSAGDASAGGAPAAQIGEIAAVYDAVALGDSSPINRAVLDLLKTRARHRPFIIAGRPDLLREAEAYTGAALAQSGFEPMALSGEGRGEGVDSLLAALARERATSLLLLPGALVTCKDGVEGRSDRMTVIADSGKSRTDVALDYGIEVVEERERQGVVEYTGYPRISKKA